MLLAASRCYPCNYIQVLWHWVRQHKHSTYTNCIAGTLFPPSCSVSSHIIQYQTRFPSSRSATRPEIWQLFVSHAGPFFMARKVPQPVLLGVAYEVAGDISHKWEVIRDTLSFFKAPTTWRRRGGGGAGFWFLRLRKPWRLCRTFHWKHVWPPKVPLNVDPGFINRCLLISVPLQK